MHQTVDDAAKFLGRTKEQQFDRLLASYHERLAHAGNAAPSSERDEILAASFIKLLMQIATAMAVIAILIFGLSNIYGNMIARGGHATHSDLRQITLGNEAMMVPANMIRFRSQRNTSDLTRLDLYAHWPSMKGYSRDLASIFDDMKPGAPLLFISVEPRDMTTDMSGRVSTIYEKFLAGPPIDAGNGLVRQAFSSSSAYFMEDLYYEANSPYPFAARCIRENDQVASSFCIRDIHIGKRLTIGYRFHANLLPQWRSLDQKVRAMVEKMVM